MFPSGSKSAIPLVPRMRLSRSAGARKNVTKFGLLGVPNLPHLVDRSNGPPSILLFARFDKLLAGLFTPVLGYSPTFHNFFATYDPIEARPPPFHP